MPWQAAGCRDSVRQSRMRFHRASADFRPAEAVAAAEPAEAERAVTAVAPVAAAMLREAAQAVLLSYHIDRPCL